VLAWQLLIQISRMIANNRLYEKPAWQAVSLLDKFIVSFQSWCVCHGIFIETDRYPKNIITKYKHEGEGA